MTAFELAAVFGVGWLAGVINTIAGGGSLLTIWLLVELGLPPTIANATNRVAVLMQAITSSARYAKAGALDVRSGLPLVPMSLVGVLAGTLAAVYLDETLFRKGLAVIFAAMGVLLVVQLLRPSKKRPGGAEVPRGIKAQLGMLAVGFYAGFIQAGVGVMVLGVLHVVGRLDLLRANALKVFLVGVWTVLALALFAVNGMVAWTSGLLLGVGGAVGSAMGVSLATRVRPDVLKICLAIAVWIAAARFAGLLG